MKERKAKVRLSSLVKLQLKQGLELLIGLPLALLFWPILGTVWGCVKLVRWGVETYLNWKLEDGHRFELATGSDSVFGYRTTNNCNSTVQGYAIVEGKFDFDVVLEKMGNMVEGNPRLKRKFTQKLGFYCWEESNAEFNLRNHVRILKHPSGGVWNEEKLYQVLEKLSDKPMEADKPMWEFLLLPSYQISKNNNAETDEPLEHFAQILRVHHAYGDGVSFCLTSNSYLFDKPVELPIDPKASFPVPRFLIFLQYVKVAVLGFFYFLRNMVYFLTEESKFAVREYSENKSMCRSQEPVTLATLKEIKNETKASVTAILLSCISAQLRKSHEKLFPGEPVPEVVNAANVNAMLPYKDDKLTNRFTIFPFYAPLAEPDAKRRLEKTNEEGYRVTMSPDPIFCYFMQNVVGDLPCVVQNALMSIAGTPLMLSNIPGILGTCHVFNGRVVDSGAWLPLIRVTGLAICTYTYCGDLRFCGIADSSVFSKADLQQLLDGIVDEVRELKQVYRCGK